MARFELPEFSLSGMGEAPATADTMFELGMMYASGRDVPVDLVSAHKWFNIAATKGHVEAARLRREIAAEMSDAEIGQAQRTARDWLKANPEPVAPPAMAPAMMLRAAA
jgi:TPR repeat protein